MNVSGAGARRREISERILLTGFMGAGKSTCGPLLAGRLGWPFRDLDAELARRHGKAVSTQLRQLGEPAFRQRERDGLAEALQIRPLVLALGGGTVTDSGSRRLIEAAGASVVYLRMPWAEIVARLAGTQASERPLWQGSEAERLQFFRGREAVYAQVSRFTVDGVGAPVEVAERVYRELGYTDVD